MSKKIKFYYVDLKYMEYLKSVDSKVSDVSLENKKDKRKFIGILFEINKIFSSSFIKEIKIFKNEKFS